ncbi:GL23686 [Drosophila persimilis]|uniref:GL23686 n=1 Tax=Drosophila persimilis TaxID=7234 RepID=B4G6B3_DROPE|nr:GL23686 [Drosophila persimilis]
MLVLKSILDRRYQRNHRNINGLRYVKFFVSEGGAGLAICQFERVFNDLQRRRSRLIFGMKIMGVQPRLWLKMKEEP